MNHPDTSYSVIEVLAPHPCAGEVRMVPCRRPARRLQLRNARVLLSTTSEAYAVGFLVGHAAARASAARG